MERGEDAWAVWYGVDVAGEGCVDVVGVGETAGEGEGGKMVMAGVAALTCAGGEVGSGDYVVDDVFELVAEELVDVESGKCGVAGMMAAGVRASGCVERGDLGACDVGIGAGDERVCADG
jgi:hypothetical protein